jgi:hypothetical protein
VHSHPPRAAGPWSPCASALMPGFVLKRSCGGFVEFVPLAIGRKMLALLAGLAEMSPAARAAAVYDPERAFMEHGVPLQAGQALQGLLQVLEIDAEGSPCSAGGRAADCCPPASCDADQVVYSRHAGQADVANAGQQKRGVSWTSCC